MKMIYWDCFLGVPGGGENSKKKVGLGVIAEKMENMFLSPCRKN